MEISCLTFDLDDTLWDVYPVIMRAEARFFQWLKDEHPHIADDFTMATLVTHRQRYFQQFENMQHDFTWLRKKWLAHIASQYRCPSEFASRGFDVFLKARNEVEFYEGTIEMLEKANRQYQVLAITNGNADVAQVGLGQYFQFAVTAAQVGVAKPDPAIFQEALRLAGSLAEQTVHIGDDPVRDVKGAADIGMKTVWVNVHKKPWPGGTRADAEITAIPQLMSAIKSL